MLREDTQTERFTLRNVFLLTSYGHTRAQEAGRAVTHDSKCLLNNSRAHQVKGLSGRADEHDDVAVRLGRREERREAVAAACAGGARGASSASA